MPRPTRAEIEGYSNDAGGNTLTELRRLTYALLSLVTGQNPDGTPFHPDSGSPVALSCTPDADGAQFPNTPCKYVILKNQSGTNVQYGFAAGEPSFTLLNNLDERVNVDNANKLWIFDADNSGATFTAYAIV
jgi:hypothetical protein